MSRLAAKPPTIAQEVADPKTSTPKPRRSVQARKLQELVAGYRGKSLSGRISAKRLAELTKQLLQQEVAFIHNDSFERVQADDLKPILSADIYRDGDSPSQKKRASGLPAFLAGLYDVPLLTAEGEAILFKRMNFVKFWANALRSRLDCDAPDRELVRNIQYLHHESESVRSRIVKSNLRLVVSIARKFSNTPDEFDELVSEGNMILLNAVDKFDFGRGFRFSTYATHSIQRHFYRRWKNQQRRRSVVVEACNDLINEVPAREEQTEATGKSGLDLFRFIKSSTENLDDREYKILMDRYGLGKDGTPKTLRQVAEDLGISKERVRQLQIKAVEKLRQLAFERRVELKLV